MEALDQLSYYQENANQTAECYQERTFLGPSVTAMHILPFDRALKGTLIGYNVRFHTNT